MPFSRLTLASVILIGSAAFGQPFMPPPIKSTQTKKDILDFMIDLGWGQSSGLDLGSGASHVNYDYDTFPTITIGAIWGLSDQIGVGGQAHWNKFNFDEDAVDDTSLLTVDPVVSYTFSRGESWGFAGFLALGFAREKDGDADTGANYQLGIVLDFKATETIKLAPYLKYSSVGTDFGISALTLGLNLLYSVGPSANLVFGLSWESQKLDVDITGLNDSDTGTGFGINAGFEFPLK